MSSASKSTPAEAWPAADRAESRHRRNHLRGVLLIATVLALALSPAAQAFTLPVTGPSSVPRMVFNNKMTVTPVCLPVTNPAGGTSVLYGQRFTDGPTSSLTPAIVLVHGIASSTEDWDFSPTWSVARALASAGYVVFSYDRLGYAGSSYYSQPGGGFTLTTQAHRAMLHDVVGDVKTGGYTVTASGDCSGATTPGRTQNRSVVIIGHSAGGWVVAGYPGEYHDVAAMIQTDISGSAGGSATSPLGGSSSGGSFTPDPNHPDYFEFFQTTQNCLDFNTYTPGVVSYVANIACTPPFLDSPYGEIADLGAMYVAERRLHLDDRAVHPGIAHLRRGGHHRPTLVRRRRLRLLQGPLRLRREPGAPAQHRAPVHGPPIPADLGRRRRQLADRTRAARDTVRAPAAGPPGTR